MPKERGADPADLIAQSRRELGLSRQLRQDRAVAADPSLGGSGYPVWYRIKEIDKSQNGEDIDCDARSIRRWNVRLLPYRHTGNRARTKLVGFDMIALITFILAWPDATLDEMATFISPCSFGHVYVPKSRVMLIDKSHSRTTLMVK